MHPVLDEITACRVAEGRRKVTRIGQRVTSTTLGSDSPQKSSPMPDPGLPRFYRETPPKAAARFPRAGGDACECTATAKARADDGARAETAATMGHVKAATDSAKREHPDVTVESRCPSDGMIPSAGKRQHLPHAEGCWRLPFTPVETLDRQEAGRKKSPAKPARTVIQPPARSEPLGIVKQAPAGDGATRCSWNDLPDVRRQSR